MATQDENGSRPGMNRRKRLSASNATSFVLLVIGAVVAVNLIGTRLFGRLDLTENKVYTLSNASKDIVRALPDYLTSRPTSPRICRPSWPTPAATCAI